VLSAATARSATAIVPFADSTVVILLGTGNPAPDPDAAGPATAIVVGSRVFLFDAGAGVMRRVRPHGLQSMTDHIVAAWKEDIDVRTNGLEQRPANGYAVRVHEISPGVVYDSAGVKITAIPVLHGSWKEAYGYRVDTPDRSIVLSGDTRPSPAIEQAARGVDVLIHEAYPESSSITQRDSAFARYRRAFHTSAAELGRLAAAAKPKLLVLYHHATPADGGAAVIATIRGAGYQGRVIFGKDLERF
jgi:ribonuclease Z